ncbi:MAG: hypothetical protein ACKVT2_17970 [Saprospiraceae bacterium]
MKKLTALIFIVFTLGIIIQIGCDGKKKVIPAVANSITPVPLPIKVPGFVFPEDSTVINGWINDKKFAPTNYDEESVYKHAWGIWAGLTAPSGQKFAGNDLLVYETWLGLGEVQQLISDKNTQGGCEGASFKRNGRALLSRPKQFEHAARFAGKKAAEAFDEAAVNFWVTVAYSPDAACYATQNQIFRQSVINKYYKPDGLGAIPEFPNKSLTLKPSYMVYAQSDPLYKLPVWLTAPNPPDSAFFGAAQNYVYVDRFNKQPAGKVAVPVGGSETDPAKIAAATINLNEFIYLTVDQEMANYMNQQDSIQGLNNTSTGGGRAVKGQIALLVAMHVTTKEISNWTWQSYYWTPNRDQPGAPSSNVAASLRPKEITGAAANYACVAAYVMLTPNNAANNDPNAGSIFGYNPYLEGGFGPSTFTYPNTPNKSFKWGQQSNCMSCHALAIPNPTGQYTTDQTIDLRGPYFKNQVSLDFAWSIQTALIKDAEPYWIMFNKK